jgi:hypothetical protein
MAGALAGIRAIDFGQWIAGPSPRCSSLTRTRRRGATPHYPLRNYVVGEE